MPTLSRALAIVTIIFLWDEGLKTAKRLSKTLFLEPSTVTPVLKASGGLRYVRRTRDSEDERNVRISLTDAGRRLCENGLWLRRCDG